MARLHQEAGTVLTDSQMDSLRSRNKEYTEEMIMKYAPSVFTTESEKVGSDRYNFFPTYKIMDNLSSKGFRVFDARQVDSENAGLAKHILRFRNNDLLPARVGDCIPELILTNSHDRNSAFSLVLGLYRLICNNGMMVSSATLGSFKIRHTHALDDVLYGIEVIANRAPAINDMIGQMQILDLDEYERSNFAKNALSLKSGKTQMEPIKLLEARRDEDSKSDLWSVYNTVQENIMKGGISYTNVNGWDVRQSTSRPIKNITDDVRINCGLWEMAENVLVGHSV